MHLLTSSHRLASTSQVIFTYKPHCLLLTSQFISTCKCHCLVWTSQVIFNCKCYCGVLISQVKFTCRCYSWVLTLQVIFTCRCCGLVFTSQVISTCECNCLVLNSFDPTSNFSIWGCLKMRCPFFPLKGPFWNQKRTPHFETYPFKFYTNIYQVSQTVFFEKQGSNNDFERKSLNMAKFLISYVSNLISRWKFTCCWIIFAQLSAEQQLPLVKISNNTNHKKMKT